MFKALVSAATLAGLLLLAGCSDSTPAPEAKKEEPKTPAAPEGAITAMTAFDPLFKVARQISPDVQTASITGNEVPGVKSEGGKYAQWTAIFVSAAKQTATTFVYTTVAHDNLLKGVNNTGAIKWAGPTRDATPFSNGVATDSDAAYQAAAKKATEWMAKNPGKPVTTFALGQAASFPAPMWYIMWGDNKAGGYAVYVNSSTGEVR
ncbi:MAG: hypothetical protein KGN84_16015 [Acidobacteriota bacterium]|nr:hypothetical protein [Acidobacteriota bacterium]